MMTTSTSNLRRWYERHVRSDGSVEHRWIVAGQNGGVTFWCAQSTSTSGGWCGGLVTHYASPPSDLRHMEPLCDCPVTRGDCWHLSAEAEPTLMEIEDYNFDIGHGMSMTEQVYRRTFREWPESIMRIDFDKLAIWAEGTKYTTGDLAREYRFYLTACEESGAEPLDESRWAEEVMGIAASS